MNDITPTLNEITRKQLNHASHLDENIYLSDGALNITYLHKNAELLFSAGDYALAANIYQAILRAGTPTGPVHFQLGRCLEAEGRLSDACAHYEESITFHPTLEAYQRVSALLIRQGKDGEAAEVIERALNFKDLSKSTRFELHKACGNCLTRSQNQRQAPERAEEHFKKALDLNPAADEIRANLGALYLQRNDIRQAKRNFTDALASNPENPHALTGLGSCAMADSDFRAAHEYFIQSLHIELNNPTAILYLIKCAYEIKTYATASRILENYIQIAPINATLLYSLAGLQIHLGKFEEAKNTALKIQNLQPHHSGAEEILEWVERFVGSSSL